MIQELHPDGGHRKGREATVDEIIDYLATKAGPEFAHHLLHALQTQIVTITGRPISDDEFEMNVTRTAEKIKVPGKSAYYVQTILYKAIPIVRVEFADNWHIHKLKIKLK